MQVYNLINQSNLILLHQKIKFYKDYFDITFDINESDIGFLPLTLNYYIKNNLLSQVDELAKILEKKKLPNIKLMKWQIYQALMNPCLADEP